MHVEFYVRVIPSKRIREECFEQICCFLEENRLSMLAIIFFDR